MALLHSLWQLARSIRHYFPAATWVAILSLGVSSLAVLATVLGWLISFRAQRRLFRFQIENTARVEVVQAVQAQTHAFAELKLLLTRVQLEAHMGPPWTEADWMAIANEIEEAIGRMNSRYFSVLAQYEVLFPWTAACRRQLDRYDANLWVDITLFQSRLTQPGMRDDARLATEGLLKRIYYKNVLNQDLLRHFQNETLGRIARRKVPPRETSDPQAPRLEMRDGMLQFCDPAESTSSPAPR